MLKDYERDYAFENDACLPYLPSPPEPGPSTNNIKLLSGKNNCTSQTDSDVVDNKDN